MSNAHVFFLRVFVFCSPVYHLRTFCVVLLPSLVVSQVRGATRQALFSPLPSTVRASISNCDICAALSPLVDSRRIVLQWKEMQDTGAQVVVTTILVLAVVRSFPRSRKYRPCRCFVGSAVPGCHRGVVRGAKFLTGGRTWAGDTHIYIHGIY